MEIIHRMLEGDQYPFNLEEGESAASSLAYLEVVKEHLTEQQILSFRAKAKIYKEMQTDCPHFINFVKSLKGDNNSFHLNYEYVRESLEGYVDKLAKSLGSNDKFNQIHLKILGSVEVSLGLVIECLIRYQVKTIICLSNVAFLKIPQLNRTDIKCFIHPDSEYLSLQPTANTNTNNALLYEFYEAEKKRLSIELEEMLEKYLGKLPSESKTPNFKIQGAKLVFGEEKKATEKQKQQGVTKANTAFKPEPVKQKNQNCPPVNDTCQQQQSKCNNEQPETLSNKLTEKMGKPSSNNHNSDRKMTEENILERNNKKIEEIMHNLNHIGISKNSINKNVLFTRGSAEEKVQNNLFTSEELKIYKKQPDNTLKNNNNALGKIQNIQSQHSFQEEIDVPLPEKIWNVCDPEDFKPQEIANNRTLICEQHEYGERLEAQVEVLKNKKGLQPEGKKQRERKKSQTEQTAHNSQNNNNASHQPSNCNNTNNNDVKHNFSTNNNSTGQHLGLNSNAPSNNNSQNNNSQNNSNNESRQMGGSDNNNIVSQAGKEGGGKVINKYKMKIVTSHEIEIEGDHPSNMQDIQKDIVQNIRAQHHSREQLNSALNNSGGASPNPSKNNCNNKIEPNLSKNSEGDLSKQQIKHSPTEKIKEGQQKIAFEYSGVKQALITERKYVNINEMERKIQEVSCKKQDDNQCKIIEKPKDKQGDLLNPPKPFNVKEMMQKITKNNPLPNVERAAQEQSEAKASVLLVQEIIDKSDNRIKVETKKINSTQVDQGEAKMKSALSKAEQYMQKCKGKKT